MKISKKEAKRYPFILPREGWYGYECIPDGWHDIIMIMCEEIKIFLESFNIPIEKYHLNQGKEKWGELHWYHSFDIEIENSWFIKNYINENIIKHYHHILKYTCTSCGRPGRMRQKAWVEPLCDKCFKPFIDKQIKHLDEKDKKVLPGSDQ